MPSARGWVCCFELLPIRPAPKTHHGRDSAGGDALSTATLTNRTVPSCFHSSQGGLQGFLGNYLIQTRSSVRGHLSSWVSSGVWVFSGRPDPLTCPWVSLLLRHSLCSWRRPAPQRTSRASLTPARLLCPPSPWRGLLGGPWRTKGRGACWELTPYVGSWGWGGAELLPGTLLLPAQRHSVTSPGYTADASLRESSPRGARGGQREAPSLYIRTVHVCHLLSGANGCFSEIMTGWPCEAQAPSSGGPPPLGLVPDTLVHRPPHHGWLRPALPHQALELG